MFPCSFRVLVGVLLGVLVTMAVSPLPTIAADNDSENVLSPETIVRSGYTGKATVELLVDKVHTLNIDSVFVPDVSHDQVITASIPVETGGREFLVVIKRKVATRLLQLGIGDPAGHLTGRLLKVSGVVEQLPRASASMPVVYRLQVTDLDQLLSIRKP